MGFYKIRNDCTKNDMKNKKRQYKGGKMTTRQTFTAFLINNNECMFFKFRNNFSRFSPLW